MKPGDLVKFKEADGDGEKYGMFLGYRTYDKKYTCSEVMWYPENEVRPVQSDLLEAVK